MVTMILRANLRSLGLPGINCLGNSLDRVQNIWEIRLVEIFPEIDRMSMPGAAAGPEHFVISPSD